MIKRIFGIIVALVVIGIIVLTVLRSGEYRSMILGDKATTGIAAPVAKE